VLAPSSAVSSLYSLLYLRSIVCCIFVPQPAVS
jgi:hypothetical protein